MRERKKKMTSKFGVAQPEGRGTISCAGEGRSTSL